VITVTVTRRRLAVLVTQLDITNVKDDNAMARKNSDEKAPDILKAAEEKMDRALLAYSQENVDPELRQRLIDDLKKATNEFLQLREELSQRRMRDGEQTVLEELVFCDCEHSADCKIDHWKICKVRIQKDAEASKRPPE
jgi:predicted metal-binding transcription factor (methanogenesis marker protein 9)